MRNIIYIPLDERPCNYLYPKYMCEVRNDINLITPKVNLLGEKKKSADIDKLWNFVFDNIKNAEAIVMSIEMMVYGGLLPSRLHHFNEEHKNIMLDNIRKLKTINKDIKVYASNLIMRTPKYNSSDEEPDYYEEYGQRIFKRAYLLDKKERFSITGEEEQLLAKIDSEIPKEYIKDYEKRRNYNVELNAEILSLVKNGDIDFLSIPQDDSSEFGYTAMDQRIVSKARRDGRLQRKVHMYPGADEVGTSLLARAVNDIENRRTKIYPFFASLMGPQIIPLYEDRPMYESLKSHIMVTNSIMVDNPDEADLILAINCPGKVMEEASAQENKDITYTSFRNLLHFVDKIESFILQGKKVIISDSAFGNGGELELITLLDDYNILDKLVSYKGWNTNCNTLGTTIAQGVIALGDDIDNECIKKNIIYHLLEDVFYQSIVRKEVTNKILPKYNISYFSLGNYTKEITNSIENNLSGLYNRIIVNSFKSSSIEKVEVFSPWNRMFEIGINLTLNQCNEKLC